MNVKAEMASGKPQKQALAIAYDVQRRSKADGGSVSPYDYVERAIQANPFTGIPYAIGKGFLNSEGLKRAGSEGLKSYGEALENQYIPEGAVKYDDAGRYYDKDDRLLESQYRPNILPVTKTKKGEGWFGSDYEGAMPGMMDVWNTVGNPFAPAKGMTLGSGIVIKNLSQDMVDAARAAQTAHESPYQVGPRFYSALEDVVKDSKIKTGSPQQWMGTISNSPGVKPSEIEWSGLKGWLDSRGGKVTKEEIQDYLKTRRPEIEQIERRADDERTAPGEWSSERERERAEHEAIERAYENASNSVYDEVARDFRRRNPDIDDLHASDEFMDELSEAENHWVNNNWHEYMPEPPEREISGTQWQDYVLPGGKNYREILLTLPKNAEQSGTGKNFRHSHFEDDEDFVAHMRLDDRKIGGKNTLFMNEGQSDWHQRGSKEGYASQSQEAELKRADSNRQFAQSQLDKRRREIAETFSNKPYKNWDEISYAHSVMKDPDLVSRYPSHGDLWDSFNDILHSSLEYKNFEIADEDFQKALQNSRSVPDAPFKKEWPDLVLKSMIRKAAEEGYSQIAWPGSPETVSAVESWGEISKDGDKYFSNGRNMTSIINRYIQDMPRIADKLVKKQGSRVRKVKSDSDYHPRYIDDESGYGLYNDKSGWMYDDKNNYKRTFSTERDAEDFANENTGHTFNVLEITPELKRHALEKGFPLFSKGSVPMPRSPYDRADDDRRRVNKQFGGSLFGLSNPTSLPLVQEEELMNRARLSRQGAIPSLDSLIGSGRTAYPRDNRIYRFHETPSDAPEYTLDIVGGKPKKKSEDAIDRLNLLSRAAMGDAQKFNRKYQAPDTNRFNRKIKNDSVENISPYSPLNPESDNAYMVDYPLREKARDAVKSYGQGFLSGTADVVGLPKTLAKMPNRLSGVEMVPEKYLELMPSPEGIKKKIESYVYGEDEKPYEPKTDWGKLASTVGEISPYIAGGGIGGGLRGGAAAALEEGGAGAILRGAGRGAGTALKAGAPLAATYPIYSGWAAGGQIPFGVRESAKQLSRAGLVNSSSAGRADKVPGSVKAGSYVVPADVVSAMGQGNTMAGARSLNNLLGMNPYNAAGGRPPRGRGMTAKRMGRFADGGHADHDVDVNISGGEYIVPPEAVEKLGGGDMDYGHEILDALAMEVRSKNISHLSKLPPPRKD